MLKRNRKNYKHLTQFILEKKSHFEKDGTQNYLVFQPLYRYLRRIAGVRSGNYNYFCKSKGLSDENITAPTTSDYSFNPQLSYLGNKARVEFIVMCS